MSQIFIFIEKVQLDIKFNGTLKGFVQTGGVQQEFKKDDNKTEFETVILKGQIIIPEKIQIKFKIRDKEQLSEKNQKQTIFVLFMFQPSNKKQNSIKIHQKELEIDSLAHKNFHFTQYLSNKLGRGSMIKYSVRLLDQSKKPRNTLQNIYQDYAAQTFNVDCGQQWIKTRVRNSSNELRSWLSASKLKSRNMEDSKPKNQPKNIPINIVNQNKFRTIQLETKKNETIPQKIQNQTKINMSKSEQFINFDKFPFSQNQFQYRIQSLEDKNKKLQRKIEEVQNINETIKKQNSQFKKSIKLLNEVIVQKDYELQKISERILRLQKNIELKQTILKEQIQRKVDKIKNLSSENHGNKIQVSRLQDDMSDKQKKHSFEMSRLRQLVELTAKQMVQLRDISMINKPKNQFAQVKQGLRKNKPSSQNIRFVTSEGSISEMYDQNEFESEQKSFKSQQSIANGLSIKSVSTIYLHDPEQSGVLANCIQNQQKGCWIDEISRKKVMLINL